MKAAVLDGYGGAERFAIRDVERPRPGPGQLLLRVRAAGVNPIDWKIRRGTLRLLLPARFPLILGYDAAGEVEEVGPEVHRFAPGDAVAAFLDSRHGGAYAEYALAGQAATAAKPEGLSFEEAAALPLAGLTAYQGLFDRGEMEAGDHVLINGGAGGVGHFAIQLAAAGGAEVTAVGGPGNQDFLHQMGAGRALDYTREDFTVDDASYDLVFDAVGTRNFAECEPALAEGGVYVTTRVGPAIALAGLKAAFASLFGGTRARARAVRGRANGDDLAQLMRLVEAGKLRPVIQRTYDLEEIRHAHAASESGHVRGKIVIRID
jgi:NADPH:quinone reductase-like Zn-dependent oxidoreductase